MRYAGLLFAAWVCFGFAVWLVVGLATVVCERIRERWSVGEVAGFALCCCMPLSLVWLARVCVVAAEAMRTGGL